MSVNSGGYLPRRSGSVNIHRYSPPLRRTIVKYLHVLSNRRTQEDSVPREIPASVPRTEALGHSHQEAPLPTAKESVSVVSAEVANPTSQKETVRMEDQDQPGVETRHTQRKCLANPLGTASTAPGQKDSSSVAQALPVDPQSWKSVQDKDRKKMDRDLTTEVSLDVHSITFLV